jgi:hypothetical protein
MQIRHLRVSNFRGIKSLDWHLEGNVLCLVGPGDSTKTTILDAIECALAPRNTLPFTDTDFFQGNVQEPITILVTVGELPPRSLKKRLAVMDEELVAAIPADFVIEELAVERCLRTAEGICVIGDAEEENPAVRVVKRQDIGRDSSPCGLLSMSGTSRLEVPALRFETKGLIELRWPAAEEGSENEVNVPMCDGGLDSLQRDRWLFGFHLAFGIPRFFLVA